MWLLFAGLLPGYMARQMTYDLRRLRRNGFPFRTAGSQRYQLTAEERRLAVFFAKTSTRVVTPSLAEPTRRSQQRSPNAARSLAPGALSSAPSTTGSPTPPSPPQKMTQL